MEPPKDSPAAPEGVTPQKRDLLFDAIVQCCRLDPAMRGVGAKVGKVKATLLSANPPYSSEEVLAFEKLWWSWSDRQMPPTVWQLAERINSVRANGRGAALVSPTTMTPEQVEAEFQRLNRRK